MLASTIQQPNNHKKTSNHTPIQVLAPDFSGPNSAPPNPPTPMQNTDTSQPATDPTTPGPFHTPSKLEVVLDTGRNSDGSQHVDDSTSEHPSAVGTNVPRASRRIRVGVCSLERR